MADGINATLAVKEGGGFKALTANNVTRLARILEKEKGKRKECAHDLLNKYALLIQGTARKNLGDDPRRIDEGRLRTSIQTFISQLFTQRLAALVFTDLEYAAFVHWGTGIHGENPAGGHRTTPWIYFDEKRREYYITSGMEANMFLLKAFNKHAPQLERDLKRCLSG